MAMFTMPAKDPAEKLDYKVDFKNEFFEKGSNGANDAIDTVEWTIPAGITLESYSNTTDSATVMLSGGTANTTYTVSALVTTTASRIYRVSFNLPVAVK